MAFIYTKRLRGWRLCLFNGCLGISHALVIFNAGAYIAMLPRVAGGLGIPLSFATWTQTDYMIGMALAFPVGVWLSHRIGEYRPFIAAFVLFALASLLCACSTSYYGYLAGRILLGFSGGITLPMGQAMVLKEFPDKRKSIGIGIWSLFTLTPFTLGPPIGGWIADVLGWRWLFWLNIPIALALSGIIGALLYQRGFKRIRRRFDLTGFILLSIALFSFQTLLNQGNDWGWTRSATINGLAVVIIVSGITWVIWELSIRQPFLDIRLFKHRNFAIGALTLFVGFLCFQGLLSMLIVQLQVSMGYSSLLAGLVFLPMAIFAKPISGIFHEITPRFDARLLASLNLVSFAAVYFWLGRFDDTDSYEQLVWPMLLEGVCLGSFFVPLTALMLHGLSPERQWRAVELASLMRIAGGAFGITLQGIVLYQRTPFHLTRIAETHHPLNTAYDRAIAPLLQAGLSESQAWIKVFQLDARASAISAINDAFWLAACVFCGLAVLVWFANPTRQRRPVTDEQLIRREAQETLAEDL
ncbi:DHA2 family efflux MFS transporter permease subunit [Methylicorpusculum oleiharenae]|uniref:DHA2 family efflux MFS transporter permease subunit n=1 Tax=Methylicorpusculum oleiharenae TaxID=1338687 RepID=UPI00135ABE5A|nr:DHA2 family efflux MFS transporter permease subunit [Methylicorpusculum oleiharenae]MCD2453236.1 DHA2 family efflux MFS transporter permease subunit [Methylicorpusculum oleiharenae]